MVGGEEEIRYRKHDDFRTVLAPDAFSPIFITLTK